MVDRQLSDALRCMGQAARDALPALGASPVAVRNEALLAAAALLAERSDDILAANGADLDAARQAGASAAFLDRLALDDARIGGIAAGLEAVAALPDPLGRELAQWSAPAGFDIRRVSVPLGVLGIIYESRPNVTADAGALCLKAGNACILRGGSDSLRSSRAIHAAMADALAAAGLPPAAIQLVPSRDRQAVAELLAGLDGTLDVVVPRGGRSLIERVQAEARVPVIGHLEGLCHVYVHRDADPDKARAIVVNSKLRRTGVCGAAETLLIDEAIVARELPAIAEALAAGGCELRGDDLACAHVAGMVGASEQDWVTEYLDAVISVRVVAGLDAATDHISRYGSGHTETIVTENADAAERFLTSVDSAIVMHNASTQFADGGEFGMGAEIGIATGRIHARGPVGANELTSYKYQVRGSGQTRP
ncbi:MAG: glutamate-5-semialdehyde dehydrogenase [Pseudomonadota bacterium]